jgi:ribonucleoside-triphosphate reductase (formate)
MVKIDKIRKRDGRVVNFDSFRITEAVLKAMNAVGQSNMTKARKVTEKVLEEILSIEQEDYPNVEQIQDLVEKHLMLEKCVDVAKAYILYRDLRSRSRNINNLLDIGNKINSYVEKEDWKLNINSCIDYHLQGLYKNIVDEVSEKYWMNEVYTEEMRALHENKDLHIHKSSSISAYCVGWDLQDLLLVGFKGVQGNVESKPPKHFRSALGQLVNFLYTLTNESPDGAVAVSSLDTYLAPFIRHDKLTYKATKQCLQEFIYNMNMPTKSGGQVVFSNVTLDLKVPEHMRKESVIIGGEYQNQKYGDYQKEMDMFNKALSEVYIEGDAKGRVFTFPIPTYNIAKDFDWDNKAYDGIWEMTGKYGIPYFANFVNSDMDPEDARSMCCRLRIDNRQLHKRGGGFFGANPLTGSIGYTTINLPRIGYQYKGDEKGFYERLKYLMDISKQILTLRRKLVEDFTERGMYPYSKFYLRTVKEKTGKYWTNHFSTIGIIGMNEACENFLGCDMSTEKGQAFSNEVLDYINRVLIDYQKESDELYNLEASPAEGASYAMARRDKEEFSDIKVGNEKDLSDPHVRPYYTNSTNLPVGYTDDLFAALDMQDELQSKYTGGTVFHAFLGERLNGSKEVKTLIRKITSNYKLPYITLTPTFSICGEHGYISGEHFLCPECNKEAFVYSRVVGKITPVQRWNPGKQSEFGDRKEYKIPN